MPSSLFQEKDCLNGRFFHKKAYFLAVLAAKLKEQQGDLGELDVSYESTHDDPTMTKLCLIPRNIKLNVYIFLAVDSPIPLQRLDPGRSNIRVSSESSSDSSSLSTTLYNTALLSSLTPKPHLLAAHTIQQSTPAFTDALTLLRVWANQRGYNDSDLGG